MPIVTEWGGQQLAARFDVVGLGPEGRDPRVLHPRRRRAGPGIPAVVQHPLAGVDEGILENIHTIHRGLEAEKKPVMESTAYVMDSHTECRDLRRESIKPSRPMRSSRGNTNQQTFTTLDMKRACKFVPESPECRTKATNGTKRYLTGDVRNVQSMSIKAYQSTIRSVENALHKRWMQADRRNMATPLPCANGNGVCVAHCTKVVEQTTGKDSGVAAPAARAGDPVAGITRAMAIGNAAVDTIVKPIVSDAAAVIHVP
jgi:hypothetical protein